MSLWGHLYNFNVKHCILYSFLMYIGLSSIGSPVNAAIPSDTIAVPYSMLSEFRKNMVNVLADGGHAELNENSICRTAPRLILALLYRDAPGDVQRAEEVLDWLISYQDTDAGTNFGSWPRRPGNLSEDPNRRDFIGLDLSLVYTFFRDKINNAESVKDAIYRAGVGSMNRDVVDSYTNPALMSALLCEFAARLVTDVALENYGNQKIDELYNRYYSNNSAWDEFNSTTYLGVDMYALMAWSTIGTEETKIKGKELVYDLWQDVLDWFNPHLKNMCPVFLRSYGMDMQNYNTIMGIAITVGLDDEAHNYFTELTHYSNYEVDVIPGFTLMGTQVPTDLVAGYTTFQGETSVDKIIYTERYPDGDSTKRVSNTIKNNWMMGGMTGLNETEDQVITGGLIWDNPNSSDMGWMILPGATPRAGAYIEGNRMTIVKGYANSGDYLDILLYAEGVTITDFEDSLWALPGITVSVSSVTGSWSVTEINHGEMAANYVQFVNGNAASCFRIRFTIGEGPQEHSLVQFTIHEDNFPRLGAGLAENAFVGGGAIIERFHNTSYVNFSSTGSSIEFKNVDGGTGGIATLSINYALGSDSRTGALIINNESQTFTMTNTETWDTFKTVEVDALLQPGSTNTIRFETTGEDFGNIHSLTVTHSSSSTDESSDVGESSESNSTPSSEVQLSSEQTSESSALTVVSSNSALNSSNTILASSGESLSSLSTLALSSSIPASSGMQLSSSSIETPDDTAPITTNMYGLNARNTVAVSNIGTVTASITVPEGAVRYSIYSVRGEVLSIRDVGIQTDIEFPASAPQGLLFIKFE